MPNKYRADLPELRGWADLSLEEKRAFADTHPSINGKDFKKASTIYDNLRFIEEFDKDTFDSYSKAERDMMFRTKVIDDALAEHFKGDKNFDVFKGLTDEGKLDLLRSNYRSQDDLEKINDTTDKAFAGVSGVANVLTGGRSKPLELGLKSAMGTTGLLEQALGREKKDVGDFAEQFYRQRNDTMLSKIVAQDNKRKAEDVGGLSLSIQNNLKKTKSADEIKAMADEIAGGEFGSPHYKAFKDAREMRHFDVDDAAKLVGDFYAMNEKYGLQDAVSNLYTSMQDYVAKHQDFYDYWVEGTLGNVNTKAAANLFNHILGYQALWKSIFEGPESVANFAEGKRRDGSERKINLFNPLYWEGVDTFNTFNADEINAARENGGVGKRQAIAPAGKEMGLKTAVSEGIKMAGFAASDVLYNYALGAVGKGIATGLGAKFSNGIIDKAASKAAGLGFYENVFPWVVAANSGLGISMAYSMGTYQQTLDEINQRIDTQIENDAVNYVDSMKGTEGYNNAVNQTLQQMFADLQAQNPDKQIRLEDVEGPLRERAEAKVDSDLYNAFKTRPDVQESAGRNYQEDRDMARKHAAAAFSADFLAEELRMTLAGVSWKTFLYDKGTRRVFADKFPGLRATEVGGELAPEAAKRARYAAIAKNIYGGFHSNYWDDVTVAFGKGIGLNKSNDYMAMKYNPEGYAIANDKVGGFLGDFLAGMDSSFEALFNPQSFYDGFIGALGTPLSFAANPTAIFKKGRQIKRSDIKTKKNPNGQYHWTEWVSQYITNPVLQEYGDAYAREREFKGVLDKANETLAKHKRSLEDIGELAMSLNAMDYARDHEDSQAEAQDKKARSAFALVTMLKDWTNDPIISKSSVVQNATKELNELNNFDSLSDERKSELVNEFLNQPDNKSVKESENAQEIAIGRIKQNAKFLSNISSEYEKAIEKIKSSPDYRAIESGYSNIEDAAKQLAFMEVMDGQWRERLSDLNTEISGQARYTTHSDPAIYGSLKGVQMEITAREKELGVLENTLEKLKKGIVDVSNENNEVEEQAVNNDIKRLLIAKVNDDITRKKDEISDLKKIDESAFLSVIPKESILHMSPFDRAYMMNPKNFTRYSKEQQAEIKALGREITMKDKSLFDAIQDAGVIQKRIEDNEYAHEFLMNHPIIAASYADHTANDRINTANSVFRMLAYDHADTKMDAAYQLGNNAFIKEAKKKNSDYLSDYISRYPDRAETLKPAVAIAKLREDSQEAVARVFLKEAIKENTPEDVRKDLSAKAQRWGEFMETAITKSDANTVPGILRNIERKLDAIENPAMKKELDAVLNELQAMDYQRNATILKKREKAQQEQLKKEEEEKLSDGRFYGWNGFRKGDTVYTLDGNKQGVVSGFKSLPKGGEVQITLEDGSTRTINSEDRRTLSKTPFVNTMEDARNQPVEGTLHDANAPGTKLVETSDEILLDDSGAPKEKSEEQKFREATAASTVPPLQLSRISSEDAANTITNAGVLVGNAIYGYDAGVLAAGVLEQRKGRQEGDAMNQFFSWLNNNKVKLQNIVDSELTEIIRRYPDTKIQFMFTKPDKSAMDMSVLNVIEYTDKVSKYHNEDNGGVFDIAGKKYLVVGALGFNGKQMNQAFNSAVFAMRNARTDYFNTHPDERYYIDPKYNTRVYEMSGGRKVKVENAGDGVQYRTLKELFENHNPRNMKLEDAMFGMTFAANGFVLFSQIPGSIIYPPSNREGTSGGVFMMIPASDRGYLPIYIKRTTFNELKDGKVRDNIQSVLDNLTSQNYDIRNQAIKDLYKLFVLTADKNISIGTPEKNVISVKDGGATIFEMALDSNFHREAFMKAIDDAHFVINLTPDTFQDVQTIQDYDDAGALMTDIARLSTANLSYTVLQMGADGNPISKTKPAVKPQQASKESIYTNSAIIDGKIYRRSGNDYFYENGNKIDTSTREGYMLQKELEFLMYIDSNNIAPVFTTPDGSKDYILDANRDKPNVVRRTRDNHIIFATRDMALEIIDRADQEARRKMAEENAVGALQQVGNLDTIDLGPEAEPFSEEMPDSAPKKTESKPTLKESLAKKQQEAPKSTQDINKPGSKSLSQLQRPTENVTFADVHASRRKELNQIAADKGWKWGKTVSEKEAFLKERGITTVGATVEDFIEMLKHCK